MIYRVSNNFLSKQFFLYCLYFFLLNYYSLAGGPGLAGSRIALVDWDPAGISQKSPDLSPFNTGSAEDFKTASRHKIWNHADLFQKSCNLLPQGAFAREDFESEIVQAITNLERLARAEYQPALCKLGDMYKVWTYGRYDQEKALEYYEKASKLGSIKGTLSLAELYIKQKQFFKAIGCYNKIIAEHGRHELHCKIGHIFLDAAQKGRYFIKDIDQLRALGFHESVCSSICDDLVHDQQLFFALGHFTDALSHGVDEACFDILEIEHELIGKAKTTVIVNVIKGLRPSSLTVAQKYNYLTIFNNMLRERQVQLTKKENKLIKLKAKKDRKKEKQAKKNEIEISQSSLSSKIGLQREKISMCEMSLLLLSNELAKYTEPSHDH